MQTSDKGSRTPSATEILRARFLRVDTSNVADVLDKLGYPNQGFSADFLPYPSTAGRLAGWAYTIRGKMMPTAESGDPQKMRACQGISPGEVSVWAGDGEGVCYFGELIATGMKERECVGALVDGGVRDVRWIGRLGFPVYARYRTPIQSIGRWKVDAWQVPVGIRGATVKEVAVSPGDFILADEDGALVIPAALVDQVLEGAEKLTRAEVAIRAELSAGLTLAEALKKYGHV
ncbi:MAG TPA: RraA family protein [Steroidobacteraceae bacterium]|nr:RraA family protein [Steroidobacteraceae bacterium]